MVMAYTLAVPLSHVYQNRNAPRIDSKSNRKGKDDMLSLILCVLYGPVLCHADPYLPLRSLIDFFSFIQIPLD